jgi:S1-C subfamily serine protease
MRDFVGIPTILVTTALLLLSLTISAGSASAQDQRLLMDLSQGGTEFFNEVSPSIVQIFNVGYARGGGAWFGSGYVIDREGHAITNFHVAQEEQYMEVSFYADVESPRSFHQARWRAVNVGTDPALDMALIRIEAPPDRFHPVRLGDSSQIVPGDTCAVFGSPGGDPGMIDRVQSQFIVNQVEFFNLNLGIISEILPFEQSYMFFRMALDSDRAGIRDYGSAVQYAFHTDAAINGGNSGGPLLNVYGEAIGTNTWGRWGENIGYSVPVNLLKRSAADILEYGRVRRPWCGIILHPVRINWLDYVSMVATPDGYPIEDFFEIRPDELRVYNVNPYSPAYEAGIRTGDVILRIDGNKYENIFDVYAYLLNSELGQDIVIEYERDHSQMPPAVVTLAEKQTRFYGTTIEAYAYGPWSFDVTRYSSDLTY